jgi:hypothetical protein
MKNVEKMIEKYSDDLTKALSNNLNEACAILTKIFQGVTVGVATLKLEDCPQLYDCVSLADNILLKGTKVGSLPAYARIGVIMETLHYDNGLPLTGYNYPAENPTEWNDYFEHYDRDQDFWEFWWDEEIYNFATDGKDIYMRVNFSLADLRASLVAAYDGASWDHDFNRKW